MWYFDELLRSRRSEGPTPTVEQTTIRPARFDNNLRPQLQPTTNRTCPLPLWKLKLTNSEFDKLKQCLKSCCSNWNHDPASNPFTSARREAALFFAEYWRRLYTKGAHSKEMVYSALEANEPLSDKFYEAASNGATTLGIRIVRNQTLDSLLYQGGLPMRLVAERQDDTNTWHRFATGLVHKKINFDELNLGIVARESGSIRDYCIQLINGIEHNEHSEMPFYCEDKNNSWFQYISRLAIEEKRRQQESNPLSLEWVFQIDVIENRIRKIEYIVNGPNRLPQNFLEEHNLNDNGYLSLQVKEGNDCICSFDYNNGFCRNTVKFRHEYSDGDSIYIVLLNNGHEYLYLSDRLDMSIPHLLYQDDNLYKLGNFIGSKESLLLVPEGWTPRNERNVLPTREFRYGAERRLSGIFIPANVTEDIAITGPDCEALTFGPKHPLYWTELYSQPQTDETTRYIIEPVYDATHCKFALCNESEDGDIVRRQAKTVFRNRWARNWSNAPSYGEIFASVINRDNFVTPIQFINIGNPTDLTIQVRSADNERCRIKINWTHGTVSSNQGELTDDGCWEIAKTEHTRRKILFTFTPDNDYRNTFRLSIKAPFRQFAIFGTDREEITANNNASTPIPYSDIDRWTYHIVGQEGYYTYGDQLVRFRWDADNEKPYILRNGQRLYIPYEGSLTTLFGSRKKIHSMLERTSRNILEAEVPVQFNLNNGNRFRFTIKEFPYTAVQKQDGRVLISNNFKGKLRLFKMDEPTREPSIAGYDNEQNCHILPEEIRAWGKTLLTGYSNGLIRPSLVNLNRYMDDIARNTNRTETITGINTQLQNSAIGDDLWKRITGWFKTTQSYDIPASSILELDCVSKDYKYLLLLAFQLYAGCNSDSTDNLKDQLITFSNDLAFQWYWLCPHLRNIRNIANIFIRNESLYLDWVGNHQSTENITIYINAITDNAAYIQRLNEMFEEFTTWMRSLCALSLTESYDSAPQEIDTINANELISAIFDNERPAAIDMPDEFIETTQHNLSEETDIFFNTYKEEGRPENEAWFYERVNAVTVHLRGNTNLFARNDEIRRSIIYCCKSANRQFIISLNNKLNQE